MPEESSATTGVSYPRQLTATFAPSMSAFCIGFALAFTSPALPSMLDPKVTSFKVSKQSASWVGGILPLGAIVGALLGGLMANYWGRRMAILLSCIPFLLSYVIIATASSLFMVLFGRSLSGFGMGVCSMAMPIYLGEALHPKVRGRLGVCPTLLGNFGIMTCYIVGALTKWRKLAIVGAIMCLPYALLMCIVPDTPRWYLIHGKEAKAIKSFSWLNGNAADARAELDRMPRVESSEPLTCQEVLQKRYIKPFCISLTIMFLQQASGYSAVLFYTVMIFNASGSSLDSYVCTIITGAVNVVATLIAAVLIDKLGRKILLYISVVTMIVTLFILAVYFYLISRKVDVSKYGWVPLVSFILYVLGFSVGIGPISWLMMGEILPTRIRSVGASLVVCFNWACVFVVTKTFQDLIDLLGISRVFGLFCFMCCLCLVFIIFMVPETRRKTLEQIEREMNK